MLIDMHNHTRISSACSDLDVEELIETAMEMGLGGICVTEHQKIEGANIAWKIGQEKGFPVFRGIEATTDMGDMLVFGCYENIPYKLPFRELAKLVHGSGGVIFAAHPFHTKVGWGMEAALAVKDLNLSKEWRQLEFLDDLDGIETINGNVGTWGNLKAKALSEQLNLPGIGGSDAHHMEMIGKAATEFTDEIRSDEDLLSVLKNGNFRAVYIR